MKTGTSFDAKLGVIIRVSEYRADTYQPGLVADYKHDICGRVFTANHEPNDCPICACNDVRNWANGISE
jgi:rubrerythrin